jgi:hypothetical protein
VVGSVESTGGVVVGVVAATKVVEGCPAVVGTGVVVVSATDELEVFSGAVVVVAGCEVEDATVDVLAGDDVVDVVDGGVVVDVTEVVVDGGSSIVVVLRGSSHRSAGFTSILSNRVPNWAFVFGSVVAWARCAWPWVDAMSTSIRLKPFFSSPAPEVAWQTHTLC